MSDQTTLHVKPVENRSLPLEAHPRRRVTAPTRVPNTDYYRRAIAKGDIALVTETAAKTA